MRRAARTDRNHAEIINAFRRLGWSVHDTSRLGGGFPDLVAYKSGHSVMLVEVKDGDLPPSRRKLTRDEEVFAENFPVYIVGSVDDVLEIAKSPSEWALNHCS